MDTVRLVNEIDDLLKEDKLDNDVAQRLMLLSLKEMIERLERVEEISKANGEYIVHYPSITWLWVHKRKGTIAIIIAVFLALYFVLTPLTISDIRHAIMDWLGLPYNGP